MTKLVLLSTLAVSATLLSTPANAAPLTVMSSNPRYFTDGSGKAIYLTGSHNWYSLQDDGTPNLTSSAPFDFTSYLNLLTQYNHNLIRLWSYEGWEAGNPPNHLTPLPYPRTGPGTALDGGLKYDLSQFYQPYFDRLRSRIQAAGSRGIYVSIMVFQGWSINTWPANPWPGHPYNGSNNINGVNGDLNGDGAGLEIHTLQSSAINNLQKAYVRKVIDTVNDLDNVLYEISNEDPAGSGDMNWQYDMINYIHSYEATKPKKHPVGMTMHDQTSNADLYASPAEWISPAGIMSNSTSVWGTDPPANDGKKVVIADTDHIEYPRDTQDAAVKRIWAWKTFTRGNNPIFMDGLTNESYNIAKREAQGRTRSYAQKMNLAAMIPQNSLSSTGYVLAKTGLEYLIYQPVSGAFSATIAAGTYSYEWYNPASGVVAQTGSITAAGASMPFTPPFSGDAVFYLKLSTPTYSSFYPSFSPYSAFSPYASFSPYGSFSPYSAFYPSFYPAFSPQPPPPPPSYSSFYPSFSPSAANNSKFMSQSVPATMTPGGSYPVTVSMQNTGTNSWTAAQNYRLGSQNPQDNTTWGTMRAFLSSSESIAPGQTQNFTFTVTAPATAGTYNFQWRMVQEVVGWFGDTTPNVAVSVGSGTLAGDLNADGLKNALDLQLMVNVILGTETNSTIRQRADLNGDGSINALDLQKEVNIVLGL